MLISLTIGHIFSLKLFYYHIIIVLGMHFDNSQNFLQYILVKLTPLSVSSIPFPPFFE
jgi:hypothetical protein